ncbi:MULTISPECIES: FAD-dependent oxidoreductase [unclassified Brevibacterium]|uniref:FAD-dependent oxidoreductase n=1 Tax=unclassified Brevibacterium TaxID=2614124 RepID=UPI001E4BC42C|nr:MULTISPECIES: FAD-dependent oxidoreductase [unclassified Brevibacterium]MCD1285515.1 isorenieratene synthase [Brevibacterium sp. CCUG 69071]MDK8434568.1 FAD-dependent oxidoreductase [Brevibacterium sp. H-BE7]
MTPRDRHALRIPSHQGRDRLLRPKHVTVIGGGIAGLAAATILTEHGATVRLIEREDRLGGRVRAWGIPGERTMSRGFHAFFRQYYNLRSLLSRADPGLRRLVPAGDYPLLRRDGVLDSFASIPRTPPFSLAGFVLSSPSFPLRGLAEVDLATACELIDVDYPSSMDRYDGESAEAFLDRLRFPEGARHLALEVFARSFFADPADFAAGELVAMFHTYFTGSSEGLLFDVPDDDYDTALWAPLGRHLAEAGVRIDTGTEVTGLWPSDDGGRSEGSGRAARSRRSSGAGRSDGFGRSDGSGWTVETTTSTGTTEAAETDAVVLAVDPRSLRELVADLASRSEPTESVDSVQAPWPSDRTGGDDVSARKRWVEDLVSQTNAPAFAVLRLWLGGEVAENRAAFLGTTGYRLLDNVSVLDRFEAGARRWRQTHGGSVVELHAYALEYLDREAITSQLVADLYEAYPETRHIPIVDQELLIEDDCGLADPRPWDRRVGVSTPFPGLVLAGDSLRCETPVALMERAATTGFMAANELLAGWRVRGTDIWSPPRRGLLRRGLIGALRR